VDANELKSIVVAEVAAQLHSELAPLKDQLLRQNDALDRLHHWKLALWANGGGGPPGWLESFRDQVLANLADLTKAMADMRDAKLVRESIEDANFKAVADRRASDAGKQGRTMVWATVTLAILTAVLAVVGVGSLIVAIKVMRSEIKVPTLSQYADTQPAQSAGPDADH